MAREKSAPLSAPDIKKRHSIETNQDVREEKRTLAARFTELLPELIKEHGSVGLELLQKVARGEIAVNRFAQELEGAPDFQRFQELGLDFFKNTGLVEENKEGGLMVDIDVLCSIKEPADFFFKPTNNDGESKQKAPGVHILKEIFDPVHNFEAWVSDESPEKVVPNLSVFAAHTFMGRQVVDAKEWRAWQENGARIEDAPQSKPLFYEVESAEDAFDVESIKNTQFHVGLWEIPGRKPDQYPAMVGGLNFTEVALGAVIYHPQYNDGMRDVSGRLLTRDGDHHKPASAERIIKYAYPRKEGNRSKKDEFKTKMLAFRDAPQDFLRQEDVSNLEEYGLLKKEDFRTRQDQEVNKLYGISKVIKSRTGLVLLNDGIIYTLGSEFGDGAHKVVYLEEGKLAGIVRSDTDGTETITHTFPLFSREELVVGGKKIQKNNTISVGLKEIEITPYREIEQGIFTEKRTGEDEEAYQKRVRVSNASEVLRVKGEMLKKMGINVGELELREQGSFASYYRGLDEVEKKTADEFIKKYKIEGLRILASLDAQRKTGSLIFELDKRLGTAEAALVLRQYGTLVKEARKVDVEIGRFFKDSVSTEEIQKTAVTEEILKRAEKLLVEFIEKQEINLEDVIDRITNEISIFLSIFKTAYQFKKEFKFEDIQGLDFETKSEVLNTEEIRQMEVIIEKNYGKTPLLEGVLKGFCAALANAHNTFYVLKHEGKIVSFDRFEKKLDKDNNETGEVEFASFNTDPAYQNSAIGTAMMEQTLELNAREYTVIAETDPMSPACINYVEKQGFDIVGHEPYKDTGISVFKIRREKGSARKKDTRGTVVSFGQGREAVMEVMSYLDQGKKVTRYFKNEAEFFGVVE